MPTLILVQSGLIHRTKDVDSTMVASTSNYEAVPVAPQPLLPIIPKLR